MCSKDVSHILGSKCRQKNTKDTEKVRKNSLKQKLIIDGMIFYIQIYTSIYSSGQDLPEYVFKTCLSSLGRKSRLKITHFTE